MSVKSESDWGLKRAPRAVNLAEAKIEDWLAEAKAENDAAPEPKPDLHVFDSGAVRSTDADGYAYHLISPIGLRRLAETYAEGAAKYGDYNWEKGMPIDQLLNHAIRHIYLHRRGDRTEDHLAHAAFGLFGAMHSEELWPALNENNRRGACIPPNVTEVDDWGVPLAD